MIGDYINRFDRRLCSTHGPLSYPYPAENSHQRPAAPNCRFLSWFSNPRLRLTCRTVFGFPFYVYLPSYLAWRSESVDLHRNSNSMYLGHEQIHGVWYSWRHDKIVIVLNYNNWLVIISYVYTKFVVTTNNL